MLEIFAMSPSSWQGPHAQPLSTPGSTATLMRPDVVPAGTKLEPTMVKLRTVTGELAPMLGRGVVAITAPCTGPATLSRGVDRLAAVREVWKRSSDNLELRQQEELWQLLWEFKDIFALTEEEVGLTHLVQHEIDTGLYNSVTKKDSYRILCPASTSLWTRCLAHPGSPHWICAVGIGKVPLSPEARPKTAFCTSRGLWQFRVLCFGLCNAPATFERLMEKVLADVPRQECLVYLDDILFHGSSFQAALGALRRTLYRGYQQLD
ncbi:hypothetical protein L3Q82_015453 [Scortum barcoo]|uniref:Uncharacterized protein n=1 Tax=Scortum barcoo TaxID=214431 RepID=A0ACB8VNK5_9TELE|nr:hypothetical protein L3Q82_015453 [Scortum barcoo]